MKLIRLTFTILVILSLTPTLSKGQISIGAQVGTHGGMYHGILPDSVKFKRSWGSTLGIQLGYLFSKDISISITPQIVNESVKLQRLVRENKKYTDSVKFNTSYFALPVYMDIISDNRKFKYSAGIELAFPQVVKSKDGNGDDVERSDVLNSTILGASFGIGWRKELNRSVISVNLIYTQGLTNLTNNLSNEPWYSQLKVNSFRLSLGYGLDFRKKGETDE